MHVLTPHELVCIFSELDIPSAGRATSVCTLWKNQLTSGVTQDEIWQNISNRFFGGDKRAKITWRLTLKSFVHHYRDAPDKKKVLFALKGGHISLLVKLWSSDPDLEALKKANVDDLIKRAASSKNPKVIKWLLSTGAVKSFPWQIVEAATHLGSLGLVQTIISSTPEMASQMNRNGKPAFSLAIKEGKLDIVAYFIDLGAKIDDSKPTAIHLAATYGQLEVLQLLQTKFPEDFTKLANMEFTDGNACLCAIERRLSKERYFKIFKWLVEHGVNGLGTHHSKAVIHYAAEWGSFKLMDYLWQLGETVHRTTIYGATPLHYACSESTFRYLVNHGANINAVDVDGRTVLSYSIHNKKFIKYLLSVGVNPVLDTYHSHFLVQMYRDVYKGEWEILFEITKQVISQGVSINCLDRNRRNMLHYMEHMPMHVARWLIENGIDINKKDRYGFTPLSTAEKSRNSSLVALIHEINGTKDIDPT